MLLLKIESLDSSLISFMQLMLGSRAFLEDARAEAGKQIIGSWSQSLKTGKPI